MKEELKEFQARYIKNKKLYNAARKASKVPTEEGQKEYMRLAAQYAKENKAIYDEMSKAGLYKEWVDMSEDED